MIFPYGLCIIFPAVYNGEVILRDTYQSLDDEENVGDQAEDSVWGHEMGSPVGNLVVLDDHEAGDKSENACDIEDGVDVGALVFLLW